MLIGTWRTVPKMVWPRRLELGQRITNCLLAIFLVLRVLVFYFRVAMVSPFAVTSSGPSVPAGSYCILVIVSG